MAELADALDLGSSIARCGGSSPPSRTAISLVKNSKGAGLETKVNILSDSEHEVEVILDYDEIKPSIEEAYTKERQKIEMPGFRKGKVPMQMVKKLYGEAIEIQAAEDIANKKFFEVVESQNLKPIGTPSLIDIHFDQEGKHASPDSKLVFKIKYDVIPDIELKDYTGLEIDKPIFKVKDEEVEAEIDYFRKSDAKYESEDFVEDKNYRITADLIRLDPGDRPVESTKSENVQIDLNNEKVNQQIVDSAIGKKTGEIFTFEFVDEHMHGEEVHREEYKYQAEIKKVEKIVLPETDEEFIKKVSQDKASNLEEFKEQIRKNISDYYTNQSETITTNTLLNEIVSNNDFEPPKEFVANIHKNMVDMEKQNAEKQGKHFDEQSTYKKLQAQAVWNAKWQIIMEKLAEKENIKVEDSDLQELVKKEAGQTGISEDKLLKYYKDSNRTVAMLEDKIVKFLKDNNNLVEIDADEKIKKDKAEQEKKEKQFKELQAQVKTAKQDLSETPKDSEIKEEKPDAKNTEDKNSEKEEDEN